MAPLLAQRPRADRSFERLYRRHVGDVYHYALAVLRNPTDAEDVTQTTFLNAYRAYRRGERPQAPQNWLIAIAHNVCRQRFRQSQRRPSEVAFEDDVADTITDEDVPSAQDIRNALGHLAFNQRAALVMRELEGRTYGEIAEILGLSVSAVETLIFRARRALREQLEGALTCHEAEIAISRQIDGRLPREERGPLRAHLRECQECARFARSQRAQRAAFRSLAAVPLPTSLASFFGGGGGAAVGAGGGAIGAGVLAKAAAVLAVGTIAGGVGYEGAKRAGVWKPASHHAAGPLARVARPAAAPAARPQPGADAPEPGAAARARAAERARELVVTKRRHAKAARGRGRAVVVSKPSHRAHPAHPAHPTHPTHPAHPSVHLSHPTHPVHPVHAAGRSSHPRPAVSHSAAKKPRLRAAVPRLRHAIVPRGRGRGVSKLPPKLKKR
jgi:RNA polymerase sigma-70 factor (ECF subfamily)